MAAFQHLCSGFCLWAEPTQGLFYGILAHWPSCISVTNSKRTIQALKRNTTVCYMVEQNGRPAGPCYEPWSFAWDLVGRCGSICRLVAGQDCSQIAVQNYYTTELFTICDEELWNVMKNCVLHVMKNCSQPTYNAKLLTKFAPTFWR